MIKHWAHNSVETSGLIVWIVMFYWGPSKPTTWWMLWPKCWPPGHLPHKGTSSELPADKQHAMHPDQPGQSPGIMSRNCHPHIVVEYTHTYIMIICIYDLHGILLVYCCIYCILTYLYVYRQWRILWLQMFFYTQLYYLIVYQYIHNLYITSTLFFEYMLHINDT